MTTENRKITRNDLTRHKQEFFSDQFIEQVAVLAKPYDNPADHLAHGILGMIGELGELVDPDKKHLVYGQELDKENYKEEGGDFLFYLQLVIGTLKAGGAVAEAMNDPEHNKALRRVVEFYADQNLSTMVETTGTYANMSGSIHMIYTSGLTFLLNEDLGEDQSSRLQAEIGNLISGIIHMMLRCLKNNGITIEQAEVYNLNKLSDRYHEGKYSAEQAQARADKEGEK